MLVFLQRYELIPAYGFQQRDIIALTYRVCVMTDCSDSGDLP